MCASIIIIIRAVTYTCKIIIIRFTHKATGKGHAGRRRRRRFWRVLRRAPRLTTTSVFRVGCAQRVKSSRFSPPAGHVFDPRRFIRTCHFTAGGCLWHDLGVVSVARHFWSDPFIAFFSFHRTRLRGMNYFGRFKKVPQTHDKSWNISTPSVENLWKIERNISRPRWIPPSLPPNILRGILNVYKAFLP